MINLDDLIEQPRFVHKWSSYQEDIFKAGLEETQGIQVQAVAGSGKTTTIVELVNRLPGDSLLLAFNKSVAETLKSRVSGATVKTLNALGHGIVSKMRRGAKLESWKISNEVRSQLTRDQFELYGDSIVRVIGVMKAEGLGIDYGISPKEVELLIDSYSLEIESFAIPWASRVATAIFEECYRDQTSFDFNDQLYMPIREGWSFPSFTNVLVDEAQDLSPIQHRMLQALSDKGARIFSVGDRRQAIYGFRGAMSNSMDALSAQFSLIEKPLSISYRCPKAVVELAKSIVPYIESSETAIEGEVSYEELPPIEDFPRDSLILCRNNGPIFDLAIRFLRSNRPVKVQSNFMEVAEKFILSFRCQTSIQLQSKLEAWYLKEKKAAEEGGFSGKLEALEDRYSVVSSLCEAYKTVGEILSALRRLSLGAPGAPIISTIHRAKGSEAQIVYFLRPDLCPSPRATKPEQIQQEENLRYVAITRSQDKLIFLPGEE